MVLIATTREGKKVAYAEGTKVSISGTAPIKHSHTVDVVELKMVQALLQVSVATTTEVQVSIPQNVTITGNSITFTLMYGAATDATPEVIAVGF